MNHILRKIGPYKGTLEYKQNQLSINFTNQFTNRIFFTNITHTHMPEHLKDIADNPRELFEIICDLADDKMVINEAEELVLLIGIGRKVKQYVINLQKADISKEQNLNKRIYELEKQLQQKQFQVKFYKEQYLLLLNNLQLKPNIQEVSKLYHINAEEIFSNNSGEIKMKKNFSSVVYQQKKVQEPRMVQSEIKMAIDIHPRNQEVYVCPGNHPLAKFNAKTFNNSHLCNICRAKISKDSVQYRCIQCDFDVCNQCITIPAQNRKMCSKNHGLRYGIANNYPLRSCDKCRGKFVFEKGYSCLDCDYDLCKACWQSDK